jgi:hypothetical protein
MKALTAAVEAGVPRDMIDAELVEAASGPDDEFAPIILAGRLWGLVREAERGT